MTGQVLTLKIARREILEPIKISRPQVRKESLEYVYFMDDFMMGISQNDTVLFHLNLLDLYNVKGDQNEN